MYKIFILLFIVIAAYNQNALAAPYSGGDGSESSPYQIAKASDLITLSLTSADWDKYFMQTENIFFHPDSSLVDWDGDGDSIGDISDLLGFSPIGTLSEPFTGHYDGNFKTITHLYINRLASDYIGLFGVTQQSEIKSIGLINAIIVGRDYVGTLVGYHNAFAYITDCFSSGVVDGRDYVGGLVGINTFFSEIYKSFSSSFVYGRLDVGGLVGKHFNNSQINYSYSTAAVSGENSVGVLVGTANTSIIKDSYSTGYVKRINSSSLTDFGSFIGHSILTNITNCYAVGKVFQEPTVIWGVDGLYNKGFIGNYESGVINNCFFDTDSSFQTTGTGASATTNTNMKLAATFSTWDFTNTWIMSSPIAFFNYPTLQWTGAFSEEPVSNEISSINNLIWLAEDSLRWNDIYIQTDDIFTWTTPSWNNNFGWTPIGNPNEGGTFQGVYDGGNFKISNIYIDCLNQEDIEIADARPIIGLFGMIENSMLTNINIDNVYIYGIYGSGALAGMCFNSIIQCSSSSGFVNSLIAAGGLVGFLGYPSDEPSNASIITSYSNAFVAVWVAGGGLAGMNAGLSSIENSFSSGEVYGASLLGGLAGNVVCADIIDSYSTSTIVRAEGSTDLDIGGICGALITTDTETTIIENCYYAGQIFQSPGVVWDEGTKSAGFVGLEDEIELEPIYNNNFFDSTVSAQLIGIGATAKSTKEMKKELTFSSWDFDSDWDIVSNCQFESYPFINCIAYDPPLTLPVKNPMPGLASRHFDTVYVDALYNNSYECWGKVYFNQLDEAIDSVADNGVILVSEMSNTTFEGDLNLENKKIIIGANNLEFLGNISGGLVQVSNSGKLLMKDLNANETKSFPITDGTNNYTVTITTASTALPDISIRINNKSESRSISNNFLDIIGPENLDATMTIHIDKAAIAPHILSSTSQLRYYNGERYVPYDGNHCVISDMGEYYLITLTNINKF
ncbi:MAG TPA: hypothetical protein PLE30_10730 [Candidatus Kapabacteria bacterium]|nr:hypothetical protein [Candidatus Kapabacteria bacterium]